MVGHVKVGSGAQIAGMAHAKDDVEAGARMGGTPARPFNEWAREVAAIRQLGRRNLKSKAWIMASSALGRLAFSGHAT